MKKIDFYLLLLFILGSCVLSKGQEIKSLNKFKKFPKEIQADVTFVSRLDDGKGLMIQDSVVYYRIDDPESSTVLSAYDMRSHTSREISKYGSGQGEFLGLMSFGVLNDTLWGYDLTQRKVSKIPINDPSKAEDYALDHWYYSTVLAENNKLLATGGGHLEKRLRIYDLASKQFRDMIDFIPAPNKVPADAWRLANESFLFYNPHAHVAALAYRYTDKVEFIDLRTETNRIAFGPDQFEPQFEVISQPFGNFVQRNDDTKFAFNGVGFVSEKYFYLSICNHHHESSYRDLAKDIYVYSTQGEPILHVKLPFYISGFHVMNDSEVFVYAPADKGLYTFSISL